MHTVLSFLCKKSEYHQESRSPERLKRGEICKFSKKKLPEDYRVLPKERSRNLILYPLRHECSIMEKKRCSFLEALLLLCASLSLKLKPHHYVYTKLIFHHGVYHSDLGLAVTLYSFSANVFSSSLNFARTKNSR